MSRLFRIAASMRGDVLGGHRRSVRRRVLRAAGVVLLWLLLLGVARSEWFWAVGFGGWACWRLFGARLLVGTPYRRRQILSGLQALGLLVRKIGRYFGMRLGLRLHVPSILWRDYRPVIGTFFVVLPPVFVVVFLLWLLGQV